MSDIGAVLVLLGIATMAGFSGGIGFAYLCLRKIIPAVDERIDKLMGDLEDR